MYVVGEEILVEPFEVEEPSSKLILKGESLGKITFAGTVISVGTGELVQKQIEKGALVQLDNRLCEPTMIAGKVLFKVPLRCVMVCYDTMHEYRKGVKDKEAAIKRQEERDSIARITTMAEANNINTGHLVSKH